MVKAAIAASSITQIDADAVVVALQRHGEDIRVAPTSESIPQDVRSDLERLFTAVGAGTGTGDTTIIPAPAPIAARVVIGVSLGAPRDDLGAHEVLRRAAGSAARAGRAYESLAFALPVADAREAGAVLEGALLGGYSFDDFRTTTAKPTKTAAITVLGAADAEGAVRRAESLAESVGFCRDLVNTPPGHLRPSAFTDRVLAAATAAGLECEVLDSDRLRSEGSGGILQA